MPNYSFVIKQKCHRLHEIDCVSVTSNSSSMGSLWSTDKEEHRESTHFDVDHLRQPEVCTVGAERYTNGTARYVPRF